jgi:hypothetical protein
MPSLRRRSGWSGMRAHSSMGILVRRHQYWNSWSCSGAFLWSSPFLRAGRHGCPRGPSPGQQIRVQAAIWPGLRYVFLRYAQRQQVPPANSASSTALDE